MAAEYYVSAEEIASIPLTVLRDIEQIAQENPWRVLDEERESAVRTRSWPTYVFVPRSVSIRAAIRAYGKPRGDQHALYFLNEFEVVAPWRVTRGVYCFDEALSAALADTSPATEIPIDVLTRLPEWIALRNRYHSCARRYRCLVILDALRSMDDEFAEFSITLDPDFGVLVLRSAQILRKGYPDIISGGSL